MKNADKPETVISAPKEPALSRCRARRLTPFATAAHSGKTMDVSEKIELVQVENEPKGYGRGRPSVARMKEIDNSIIEAATTLFLSDGFDAVSMEAIANATPLSKTTLYSRFASKEVLLAAVINNRIEKWSAASAEHDHEMPDDLQGRLFYHAMAITHSLQQADVRGFMRLTLQLSDRFPSISRTMYEGYKYNYGFVAQDIETTAERDGLKVRDAKSVAQHFVSAIIGWNMQEMSRGGASLSEATVAAKRCTELFYAARSSW